MRVSSKLIINENFSIRSNGLISLVFTQFTEVLIVSNISTEEKFNHQLFEQVHQQEIIFDSSFGYKIR